MGGFRRELFTERENQDWKYSHWKGQHSNLNKNIFSNKCLNKNDEAAKIIIAVKKSRNNTLERKVNNTPKMTAVN